MAAQVTARSLEDRIRRMTPVSAPPDQREGAAAIYDLLDRFGHGAAEGATCRLVGPGGETIEIPESVFYMLARVAEVLARGDSITVVPVGKEMTSQQAADLLNISRQYLVRLLDEDRLPYRKTGKHRRLRVEDVIAYKEQRNRGRRAKLDELARMSEDAGGYGELK